MFTSLAYQIRELQITRFLAEARMRQGDEPSRLPDFVWRNGNVPIELQRREYWAGDRFQLVPVDMDLAC